MNELNQINCPCGTNKPFNRCCGPYIAGQATAHIPEALMRSRYTAYTQANVLYIQNTMKGKALLGFDLESARAWAARVQWINLQVLNAPLPKDNTGQVEFIARFIEDGKLYVMHEISEFLLEAGQWFYIDGVQHKPAKPPEKLSRNTMCPCGSKKKFKQCHGKNTAHTLRT